MTLRRRPRNAAPSSTRAPANQARVMLFEPVKGSADPVVTTADTASAGSLPASARISGSSGSTVDHVAARPPWPRS